MMSHTNRRMFTKIGTSVSIGLLASLLAAPAVTAAPAMVKGLMLDSAKPAKSDPVKVGVVTAVAESVTGTSAQKLERILKTGTRLIVGERIETPEGGRIDILFSDGSSITMGPNADLVIDIFRYDAKAKTGKIALSSSKGEFRFVGGRITKKTPLEFKTPTAMLGIKGGINQISIPASGDSVTTAHVFGMSTSITTPDGETTDFTRQEYQATIKKGGEIKFSRLTQAGFAKLNKKFERPIRPQLLGKIVLHEKARRVVAVGAPRIGHGIRPVVVPALSEKQLPKVSVPRLTQISKLVRTLRSIKRPPNVQRVLARVKELKIPRLSGDFINRIIIIDGVPFRIPDSIRGQVLSSSITLSGFNFGSGSIDSIFQAPPPIMITGPN